MKKTLGVIFGLFALTLLLTAPAFAQSCASYALCQQGGSATVESAHTVRFIYTGGDGEPGASFSVDFFSTPEHIGNFNFDSNGNFDILVRIPSDASQGTHTLRASGPNRFGGVLTVTATVEVVRPGGRLTPTGAKILPITLVGLGTVLAGGGAIGFARRRRTHRAA